MFDLAGISLLPRGSAARQTSLLGWCRIYNGSCLCSNARLHDIVAVSVLLSPVLEVGRFVSLVGTSSSCLLNLQSFHR